MGPSGGTLTLSGTAATAFSGVSLQLIVPPNALTTTVNIRVTETEIPPPVALLDWSPVYYFEPAGLVFAVPVNVRMPYSSTYGLIDRNLALYWSSDNADECSLSRLSDSYVNAGFLQASVRRLGWAMAGAPRPEGSACP